MTKRPSASRPRAVRILAAVLGGSLLLVAGLAVAGLLALRASLPALDGEAELDGLASGVVVHRDELGTPTVEARDRLDAARATGWLHAQDRFFQMDLLRRRSAGELAELLGPALAGIDRDARPHGFRGLARARLGTLPPARRALLEAYAEGVNAGLAALGARPPEYFALRRRPARWEPEDAFLVAATMFLRMHDDRGSMERTLAALHEALPSGVFALLAPPGSPLDAPLTGPSFPRPEIPGPEALDLRGGAGTVPGRVADPAPRDGSNAWAVAGAHTVDGRGLLAVDMHLGLSVPNTWYRVELRFGTGSGLERRLAGITLPGTPAVIAGSNGSVAWGFTNGQGDWTDLVLLAFVGADSLRYRTPDGPVPFGERVEAIRVAGADPETVFVRTTRWGPVLEDGPGGRPCALAWTAHEPASLDLGFLELESARTATEALDLAPELGAPGLNLVVADEAGHIGWTLAGLVPRRRGFDGRLPASRADGSRGWDGFLPPDSVPRVVDPPAGRIWSANQRHVGGEELARLGDGGYASGARAGQIRDALLELESATEAHMLSLQLDDRAIFLEWWRDLLERVLTDAPDAALPARAELRAVLAEWSGRAEIGSAAHRLVRGFRMRTLDLVLAPFAARARAVDPGFDPARLPFEEAWLRTLVTERPPHLLDPRFEDWDGLLRAAADSVRAELTLAGSRPLAEATWGERNRLRMRHPLSYAVPALGRWLDLPPVPLPGDAWMPRVQRPDFGASERMVVAPGREERGFFHMPGGQSGHFLSPFYRAGHEAWVEGLPTPLLPGPPAHTLRLNPPE